MENFADLYSDYLVCSSAATTATGTASLLSVSHDKITRSLSKGDYDSKYLWNKVKPMVQELTTSKEEVILCFDNSIEEKMYSDESELICWHCDHVFGRNVKGVNFLTAIVDVGGAKLPVAVSLRWSASTFVSTHNHHSYIGSEMRQRKMCVGLLCHKYKTFSYYNLCVS